MMKNLPGLLATVSVMPMLAFSANALAYIDPGTGSLLLQGLIAAVAGIAVTAGVYWDRFKAFFRRRGKPPGDPDEDQRDMSKNRHANDRKGGDAE